MFFSPMAGGGFSYLLDEYPNAQFAYSFRLLRSAYSGNSLKIRRSSDNTLLDIGFVDNVLDMVSLLAFCGAGDGFVHTLYDQTGNARNSVQTTNANQCQLVSSGSVLTVNGKPSMWAGSSGATNMTSVLGISGSESPQSYFCALKGRTGTGAFVLPYGTVSGGTFFGVSENGSVTASENDFGTPTYYVNGTVLTSPNRNVLYDNIVTNSLLLTSVLDGGGGGASANRTLQYTGGFHGNYDFSEIVNYKLDKNSDRVAIENNIKTYYGI